MVRTKESKALGMYSNGDDMTLVIQDLIRVQRLRNLEPRTKFDCLCLEASVHEIKEIGKESASKGRGTILRGNFLSLTRKRRRDGWREETN